MSKSDRERPYQFSEMDQEMVGALLTVFLIWLVINAGTGFIGMLSQGNCDRVTAVKHVEVAFPGYRIGRWLMKPIHSCIDECGR